MILCDVAVCRRGTRYHRPWRNFCRCSVQVQGDYNLKKKSPKPTGKRLEPQANAGRGLIYLISFAQLSLVGKARGRGSVAKDMI